MFLLKTFFCFYIEYISLFFIHTSFMKSTTKVKNKIKDLQDKFLNNPDLVIKNLSICDNDIAIVFIDELSNQEEINRSILLPLKMYAEKNLSIENLQNKISSFSNAQILEGQDIYEKILRGFAVLFVDNDSRALGFNTVLYPQRSIEEPPTSTVINGPREGFTETLKTNLSLIRKRLVSLNLKIEELVLGRRTKTRINLLYFNDIADSHVVNLVKQKLSLFDIDGVIDSYFIKKFLEDKPNSIFRQVGNCEKPDIACSKLL